MNASPTRATRDVCAGGRGQLRLAAQRGLSLIELVAVITVLMVAIPPLTGLYTQVASGSVDDIYQGAALSMAESLMEEIVSKDFEDPDLDRGSFGTEEDDRAGFDDIDDYDGLSNAPPRALDGTALSDYGGMGRRVLVDNVRTDMPDPVGGELDGSTPLKRIRVIVAWTGGRGGELTLSTLRARLIDEDDDEEEADDEGLLDEDASAASATAMGGSDKIITLDLVSICADDLEIETFSLGASGHDEPPNLSEIKLGTKKIHKNVNQSLPTGETTLNYGSSDDRTIPAGAAPEARLTFKDDFDDGEYTLTLVLGFVDGRSDSVRFEVDFGSGGDDDDDDDD